VISAEALRHRGESSRGVYHRWGVGSMRCLRFTWLQIPSPRAFGPGILAATRLRLTSMTAGKPVPACA